MTDVLTEILELARWAPSGDNTQPWRFERLGPDHVAIHGFDTRDFCVYDLDGHPSHLAHGALLETLSLAATLHGLASEVERRRDSPPERPVFDVRLRPAGLAADPLAHAIRERRVQRRALSRRPLPEDVKRRLVAALPQGYGVRWFESPGERRSIAWLNVRNAKIRLTIPEAYTLHRDIIEWDVEESATAIPSAALGASAPTLVLMRWAMQRWGRIAILNRYLGGTIVPRLELDLIPGLGCAAHVALIAPSPLSSIDDYVAAGRAMQRFWLAATVEGLQYQPEYTPIVFARYDRDRIAFTGHAPAVRAARRLRLELEERFGKEGALRLAFLGRVGYGEPARSRSTRRPLAELMTA